MSQEHGYYSQKQFNILLNDNNIKSKQKYIYWETENGKIVQVTEVINNPEKYHNNFDDVIYLGKLKKWHHNK